MASHQGRSKLAEIYRPPPLSHPPSLSLSLPARVLSLLANASVVRPLASGAIPGEGTRAGGEAGGATQRVDRIAINAIFNYRM